MNNWKRNIMLFITGQTISLFGSMLVQYAITWYITLKTQSGAMMTLSILCGFVPQILLSPFAGVWADRYDRKKMIAIADSAIAVVSILTAIVFMFGYREIWILFAVSVLRSFGQAAHSPAVSAAYPEMVPKEHLMKVQGLSGGIQSATMILAPIAGATLLAFTSMELIFSIDFFTALLAVSTLLLFVKIPKRECVGDGCKVDYLLDMKLGFKYIKEHTFLIPFFLFSTSVLFFIAPLAFLTPLQVVRNFGEQIWRLSAIEIGFSLGMAVGGVAIAAIGGFRNRIVTMIVALATMAAMSFGIALAQNFWFYLFFMFATGLALPFYNTPAVVMIQEKVDRDYMGRVFSVMGMLSGSAMPLGMLVFGPIADAVPIGTILIGTGIILLLIGAAVLMNRGLLRAGKKPTAPTKAAEVV
ncbi:MAG: MFS transporter [Tenericutes bacterium GWF2_57_13]|nr:MAG: MFS transporter [Tenericutes bacterium GWF2_57_13]